MKPLKFFFAVIAILCLAGCGVMQNSVPDAQTEALVQNALDTREFKMEVSRIVPLRGQPRYDFGYFVKVKDGHLVSYLPYFGVSRVAAYNEGSPLVFEADLRAIQHYQNKKGGNVFEFVTANPANPSVAIYYQLTFWDNGNASLTVSSTGRDRMSYGGQLVALEEESEQ